MAFTGYATNTHTPPCLVYYKGYLHLFFVREGGKQIEHAYSDSMGDSWQSYDTLQGQEYFVGTTSAGVCALVDEQDVLNVYYRDGVGEGIYNCTSTDGATFQNNHYIGITCDDQPHGTLSKEGLFLAYNQSSDNAQDDAGAEEDKAVGPIKHQVATTNGILCLPSAQNKTWPVIDTQRYMPPSLTYFNNKLYFFYKVPATGTSELCYIAMEYGKPEWNTGSTTCTGSDSLCSVVDNANILHIFYRDGAGKGILHAQSSDGLQWEKGAINYIGISSRTQPTACVLPNGMICVASIDADGNGIMFTRLDLPKQTLID